MLHALIMAGGSGTRFWPRSRKRLPKQFLHVGSERSLLQETASRLTPLVPSERMWVVTGETFADETRRQLRNLDGVRLILEPCGRNTAPCVALAALVVSHVDPNATLVVVPADHVIRDIVAFQADVERAAALVDQAPERLVLFGVTPHSPATGFGYIHRGAPLSASGVTAFRVAEFKEKPDAATAAAYVASGDYFWNCGIFVWRAETILKQIENHAPSVTQCLEALRPHLGTTEFAAHVANEFPRMPSVSIDYAVLEKSANVYVLPASFDWDDVGSWPALSRLLARDEHGNVVDGLACAINTANCVVASTPDHLVATLGVRDLVVVHTPTATLVANRHDETGMRELIAELERRGLSEFL